ncbi:MAG: type I methionyl aminopeptidase [Patescibacteria group bacterium]
MVKLKNKEQIEKMGRGGNILASVLDAVCKKVKPGIGTKELTLLAEQLIQEKGGKPSFLGYEASWAESLYPAALCVSINQEVVHGLAVPNRILEQGDIVGLDCGLEYEGMFTDMSMTVGVGKISKEARKLIRVAEECLYYGIKRIKPGRKISDISKAIQKHAEENGFSVVYQLVGHGVGFKAHEDPEVPNYFNPQLPDLELKPGMTLAVEPMVNMGGAEIKTLKDGWTVITSDKKLSAHFEHTVAVTEKGYMILTK